MDNKYEYIQKHYQVPAEFGRRVKYGGFEGTIIGTNGLYLRIMLDKDVNTGNDYVGYYHPTWEIEYLDEVEK
ncbi:MAG TPA: hypothetical protein PLP33_30345 [Leptospiraceae bacterium]|nr:hypothetical protein [Leptospiraceae bacterium]